MNSDDPLAPARGLTIAAIAAILLFWLPVTITIIVAVTR